MNLLIDLGNTRLKWVLVENEQWCHQGALQHLGPDFIRELGENWGKLEPPQRVLLSSVASEQKRAEVVQWCKQEWQLPVQQVSAISQGYGISNAYTNADMLGSDRWLAMIAAFQPGHAPVIVISCGSAITIDMVDTQGQHLGGYIAPGLQMLQHSLAKGTAAGHISDMNSAKSPGIPVSDLPGTSTVSCVANGCLLTAVGFIMQAVSRFEAKYEAKGLSCILTGGDAATLLPFLPGQYMHVPDLVLKGLAVIAGD